jgi:hypothetical protein
LVVLLLVVVWLVVLVPIALRKFSEWQVTASVAQFRLRTRAMGRACPATPHLDAETLPASEATLDPEAEAHRKRRERERAKLRIARRRRTLLWLAGTLGASFVLGAIPPLRGLWDLSLATFLLATGYVALLVRIQRAAAAEAAATERAEKVVPLRRPADRDAMPGGVGTLPPARPAFVLVDVRA